MGKKTFFCIDAHTCGNPVRVVKGGGPTLKGINMSEKRQDFLNNHDWIRKSLMFEPRGHDMMSGSILYPPHNTDNDAAVLFIETSGCLPMCGHGIIGTITVAIEEGLISPRIKGHLNLETPAGLVKAQYLQENSKVKSVKITNVPSFLYAENLAVVCDELGELSVDVAYGGNFYCIVDPQKNFKGIENYSAEELIKMSRKLRQKLNDLYEFVHPVDRTISGLTHILWTGRTLSDSSTARNAVFYGDKAIDRSPCGTGTSARMAQWYAKGDLRPGEKFIHESYIGSQFTGQIEQEVEVGEKSGIIPSISGWAMVTGYNTIVVDDLDPYALGFQII